MSKQYCPLTAMTDESPAHCLGRECMWFVYIDAKERGVCGIAALALVAIGEGVEAEINELDLEAESGGSK